MIQENTTRRGPFRIAGIVVICILAVLIVLTFAIFGMFRYPDSAPNILGRRVYIVQNDRMEPRIPNGAAVFVKEGTLPSENNVVLCRIDNRLWVLGFVGTETADDGSARYLVKYDNATDDKTWGIAQSDIVGVAETYDAAIGSIIRFASSKAGMLIIVILPCILIIAYEIIMLFVSSQSSADIDEKPKKTNTPREKSTIQEKAAGEPVFRRVNDSAEEKEIEEKITAPIDIVAEEKYVEKQLRRANTKLSGVIHETVDIPVVDEISIEPLGIEIEPIQEKNTAQKSLSPTAETKPAAPAPAPAPSPSLSDLSPSRIDELIKLLEEEKRKLNGDK